MKSPLREALFSGRLVVDYGSIISVFTGKSVKNVILWLIKHLGARLPEGLNAENAPFLFVGHTGQSPVKLTQGVYPPAVTHMALRADTQELFSDLSSWLVQKAGFKIEVSAVGESETERWYAIYANQTLGFSIHLSWRKNPPRDPAVTHGGAPQAPSTLLEDQNDEEGDLAASET